MRGKLSIDRFNIWNAFKSSEGTNIRFFIFKSTYSVSHPVLKISNLKRNLSGETKMKPLLYNTSIVALSNTFRFPFENRHGRNKRATFSQSADGGCLCRTV